MSPTRFHNSVHNAAVGYWTIATGCHAAIHRDCAPCARVSAPDCWKPPAWWSTEQRPVLAGRAATPRQRPAGRGHRLRAAVRLRAGAVARRHGTHPGGAGTAPHRRATRHRGRATAGCLEHAQCLRHRRCRLLALLAGSGGDCQLDAAPTLGLHIDMETTHVNRPATRWCVLIPCLNEESAIRRRGRVGPRTGRRGDRRRRWLGRSHRRHRGHAAGDAAAPRPRAGARVRRCACGFREALRQGFDAVLSMDGDGQHLASDIPRMRGGGRGPYPRTGDRRAPAATGTQQPVGRRRANAFADWGISWACAQPVADTQSGQRWYPSRSAGAGRASRGEVRIRDGHPDRRLPREAHRRGFGADCLALPRARSGAVISGRSRDVTRIVIYTIGRVLHYGHIVASYRRSRRSPPVVVDDRPAGPARNRSPLHHRG